MTRLYRLLIFLILTLCSVCAPVCLAGSLDLPTLDIGNLEQGSTEVPPYFFSRLDAAGYSDATDYGKSPIHPYAFYHELLSGEWAAAIYYDGIDTDNVPGEPTKKAMWLTDRFLWPDWITNSDFEYVDHVANDNLSNPTPPVDSAWSIIRNNVTVHSFFEKSDKNVLRPCG